MYGIHKKIYVYMKYNIRAYSEIVTGKHITKIKVFLHFFLKNFRQNFRLNFRQNFRQNSRDHNIDPRIDYNDEIINLKYNKVRIRFRDSNNRNVSDDRRSFNIQRSSKKKSE